MIVGVAIRTADEKIVIKLPRPNRHCHCLRLAGDDLGIDLVKTGLGVAGKNQGFYTHTGKYLDREQAMKYVKRIKQPLIPDETGRAPSRYLFSEDVW